MLNVVKHLKKEPQLKINIMTDIKKINEKFKKIGLETENKRNEFLNSLKFDFKYSDESYQCIQNTYSDDTSINNLKNDELCPTGTKS